MKKLKMKNNIGRSEYDSMLYKDIEMDLKKEKSPIRKRNQNIKKQKVKKRLKS